MVQSPCGNPQEEDVDYAMHFEIKVTTASKASPSTPKPPPPKAPTYAKDPAPGKEKDPKGPDAKGKGKSDRTPEEVKVDAPCSNYSPRTVRRDKWRQVNNDDDRKYNEFNNSW